MTNQIVGIVRKLKAFVVFSSEKSKRKFRGISQEFSKSQEFSSEKQKKEIQPDFPSDKNSQEGLAAKRKAKAIGRNQIGSTNQKPVFQILH